MERMFISVKEAAEMLALSQTKVYELTRRGKLEAVYVGRSVRLPYASLVQFVEELRN